MNYLETVDFNSDRELILMICATFAVHFSHLCEDEPGFPEIKGFLLKSINWRKHSILELNEAYDFVNNICEYNPAIIYDPQNPIFNHRKFFAMDIISYLVALSSGVEIRKPFEDYVIWDLNDSFCGAIGIVRPEKILHTFLNELLPLVIKHQVEFGNTPLRSPEKIFNHLNAEDKMVFLFNLEIFTKT